jgi:tripeptide aminopeptidase
MIDRDRMLRTFIQLARIDSPSGDEEAIASELTGRLTTLGFSVQRDAYGNVIASEDGDNPLILSAHMDTVEPGRGIAPMRNGDRLESDGSTIVGGDCKAGITIILEALQSIRDDGTLRTPVQVVISRDEEMGLLGAKNLDFSMVRGREAIVFDGEGPVSHITSGSPTYLSYDVDVTGRAAHAGVEPEKGISAIRIASEMIAELPDGRLDDETTFNVGMVGGGSVRNAVPEHATFGGETRSHDQATLDGLRVVIENVLDGARTRHPGTTIVAEFEVEFEAYKLDPDAPVVLSVTETLESMGLNATFALSGGGTDANVFRSHGVQSVVVGVADHNAHTVREYVDIDELEVAIRFCEQLLVDRAG